MKTTATAIAMIFLASSAWSEQLDAHEHGVGQLNIAIEDDHVHLEFTAPGADIVGFEYKAKSDEDHAAIDAAIEQLESPLDLFVMPADAGCTVAEAHAALEGDEGHKDHDGHDDHDHDDHADDDHDNHADHGDHDEHADHDDHDDHDDHAEENHTEFHAEYELTCANPEAIDQINFAYFEAFNNAHELEIVLLNDNGATSYEVDHDDPVLVIGG